MHSKVTKKMKETFQPKLDRESVDGLLSWFGDLSDPRTFSEVCTDLSKNLMTQK